MNLRNHLLREAGKLASSQTVRRIKLWAEILRLETQRNLSPADIAELQTLKADVENCSQAAIRFGDYRPYEKAEPSCPYCWIVRGENSELRPGKPPESYECGKCQAVF